MLILNISQYNLKNIKQLIRYEIKWPLYDGINVSIITSFCCRLYGIRCGKNKIKKIQETLNDKNI